MLFWLFSGRIGVWRAQGSPIIKGLIMFNEESYFETIDRIAERDGLDLIVNELKLRGYDAVIDQTGGFVLCVGVHGSAGYLYANEDCVCFYTHDELDEGEFIAERVDEDNEGWAIRVGNIYALNIEKVGQL